VEAKKIFKILMDELGFSIHEAQRYVDRKRVFLNGVLLEDKASCISGVIEVVMFEPDPSGLKPIFETEDFAVFEKPSGLLVHPRKREDVRTLNDDIKYLFGKDANAAHRIDKETSGLVLVGKNKENEVALKNLFEAKKIYKEYLAFVNGEVKKEFLIDEKLIVGHPSSSIKIKVHVDSNGKESKTKIEPIQFYPEYNVSLVKAIPLTGRQHQIRAHLFHVKHNILGDTIYGIDEVYTDQYLDGILSNEKRIELTKSSRLLLHANKIKLFIKI
jgi:23S rRNA pseudouridine1911/1915/1917 synthase